jgi:hypothetical protein
VSLDAEDIPPGVANEPWQPAHQEAIVDERLDRGVGASLERVFASLLATVVVA